MAPRKQLAPRMRRPHVDDSAERRTKRRNDPAPASPPSSSSPPALQPESPTAVRFSGRVVVPGRKVDFNFFGRENFLIGEWIRHQGWIGFCSLDLPFYPHLMREFYSSLRRGAGSIECIVKGVKIVLNDVRIGEILGIPHDGDAPERLQDRSEGLRCILGVDDVGDMDEVRANQLSVEMRILHHMIARIFIPKTGRFDFISERELAFMVYIVRGQPLNLSSIMLHMMREAATRAKVCLPYGMALTLIFSAFGVDLEDEPSKALMNTDTYNDQSLRRMGFRKVQGIWSRGLEQQRPQAQGEQMPSAPATETGPSSSSLPPAAPASPVPAPAPPPPVFDESILQRMMDSFSGRMMEQFTLLREQVSTTCSRVEHLQTEVSRLSARLSVIEDRSLDADLRSDIRCILEKISVLEQRASEPTVDDVSSLAHEAARLRSVFDAGLITVQETYQDLRDRHRDATLMFLTDIRRLTERVEEALARPPPPTPASSSRPPFRP